MQHSNLTVEEFRNAKTIGTFSSEGIAYIQLANEKYGYVNIKGETVVEPKWDDARSFSAGIGVVSVGKDDAKKLGAVNAQGKTVLDAAWKKVNWYPDEGLLIAENEQGVQAFTKEGKPAFNGIYESLTPNGGVVKAKKDGKFGFLSVTGEQLLPFAFDEAKSVVNGRVPVKENGKWGLVKTDGTILLDFQYNNVFLSEHQLWVLTASKEYCKVKEDGSIIRNLSSALNDVNTLAKGNKADMEVVLFNATIGDLGEKAAMADAIIHMTAVGGVWLNYLPTAVMITENGGIVMPGLDRGMVVSYIVPGAEGEYVVNLYGLKQSGTSKQKLEVDYSSSYSALVDGKGNYIIAPGKYDSISWYESAGLYTVKLNKQYGLMDKGGKIVVYPFYDSIALSANLYRIKKAGMYGYIDRSGNALIPYIYSNARDFSNGYAAVKDADGWHIMDASGNFVH